MNLTSWRTICLSDDVLCCIISLVQCAKLDWTMWWMLYPHGVTAACKVSESVPALQQISANFCRGGEKMML